MGSRISAENVNKKEETKKTKTFPKIVSRLS